MISLADESICRLHLLTCAELDAVDRGPTHACNRDGFKHSCLIFGHSHVNKFSAKKNLRREKNVREVCKLAAENYLFVRLISCYL